MKLDLNNNMFNNHKNNEKTRSFIKELQEYLGINKIKENLKKEHIQLDNPIQNEKKITVKYRDKMLIERSNILINYSNKTSNKGEMYYIYSNNSKMEDCYNLCACEEKKSHIIIEANKQDLPYGASIGSILRKNGDKYILDEDATLEIAQEIDNMESKLLEEQDEFLKSKRIEEHIYELSEKDEDRVWLFDITSGENEAVEEIYFPIELLSDSKEGDLFMYKNGEYKKY